MNKFRGKKSNNNVPEEIPTIVVQSPLDDRQIPYADESSSASDSNNKDNQSDRPQQQQTPTQKNNSPSEEIFSATETETETESPPAARRASLRRNSISLPNLEDLELQILRDQHQQRLRQVSEQERKTDFSNSENDEDDDDELSSSRTPLRNARRKSVSSPKMLKPPGEDESDTNSPANSITSINSLASLLREKLQMFPTPNKKKKPSNYKTKIFVGILFLTIAFLVGFAYNLYNQKVLQKAYFEKIKLNKAKRVMKIYNYDGEEIIQGRLGTTLNYNKVHPCLPADDRGDGSICLEWMNRARLYLHFYELHKEVKCYNLKWLSLSDEIAPTDCFDLTAISGHWYGGGQMTSSAWPLERGNQDFAPFITGRIEKNEWGNVLKRYFINSKGAAIIIDDTTPLYVAIKGNDDKELCLKAQYDDFAFVNRQYDKPHLNYSICTSTNMTRLHSFMTEKSLWDGLKQADMNVIYSLLTEPLWEITAASKSEFTEGTVSNYTEDVIALGFLKQGHVLLNEFWQKQIGDFTVDTERFPTLEETITIMHRRGFRIVFSVQPFISTESENFAETVDRRLLISERSSDYRIPALTRYKSLGSAGVLDVTNNRTIPWLLDKLKSVMNKYQFDAYYLDFGVAYNMPHYYQCEKHLINPDYYKTIFTNSLQGSLNLFCVNSAIKRPRAPTFVSLPQFESSWDGLRRVIPTMLTYGLNGYPFLIPGAVGGDYEAAGSWSSVNITSEIDILLPDKELYVRWLQLATFLPVIRFTHLPSKYGDDKLLETAKVLTSLRQKTVTPLLKKYANEALDSGLPLIRPLWMLDSSDAACHAVIDEFSIGDDLIVAPVLYSGLRNREVYLPAGVWKDGIDGSLRKGSRWIHDYRVEEDQVAYFEKMPDNTRF